MRRDGTTQWDALSPVARRINGRYSPDAAEIRRRNREAQLARHAAAERETERLRAEQANAVDAVRPEEERPRKRVTFIFPSENDPPAPTLVVADSDESCAWGDASPVRLPVPSRGKKPASGGSKRKTARSGGKSAAKSEAAKPAEVPSRDPLAVLAASADLTRRVVLTARERAAERAEACACGAEEHQS